jgi:Tol biopolymer transport system component
VAFSADGRYVVFSSLASNLAPNDTNGTRDVFRHDRQTGATVRISANSARQPANGESSDVAISPDGWLLAFHSQASNLDGEDENRLNDVFLR